MYGGYSYIDKNYKPSKDDFIVLLWVNGEYAIEKLAEGIAAESSVGTWTKISTMNDKVFKYYRAQVYKIIKTTAKSGFIYIAYPYEHFDAKNVMQFQASILGNLFGLKELKELYVLDISFPEKYQKQFKGPLFGIEGIRKYVGTTKSRRPHVGTIVKPKVGLSAIEFSRVAYTAWANGLDLVKDDENLVDQKFCPWEKRFDHTFKMLDKAETETGEHKLYASNITDSSFDRMMERMDYIREHGSKMVMLDVYVLGIPAVMHMVDVAKKCKLFVHAHRAGYAAHHRGSYGVNFQIYEKFYRLIGVDQLHIGTGVGKMEGAPQSIKRLRDIAIGNKGKEKFYLGSLDFTFGKHIKPVFPVASGGVDPGMVDSLIALHGKDVVIQAGGGVHGHPNGTAAGSRALRFAVECATQNKSIKTCAKTNKDLAIALKKFGYNDPKPVLNSLNINSHKEQEMNKYVENNGMKGLKRITEKGFIV